MTGQPIFNSFVTTNVMDKLGSIWTFFTLFHLVYFASTKQKVKSRISASRHPNTREITAEVGVLIQFHCTQGFFLGSIRAKSLVTSCDTHNILFTRLHPSTFNSNNFFNKNSKFSSVFINSITSKFGVQIINSARNNS